VRSRDEESRSSGKPGTKITVHLSWAPAGSEDAFRIYNYRTGEGPGFGKCIFDTTTAELLAVTQPGATSADVSLDEAETGAGVRCIYVVSVNAAGESAPTLAWRSS
jgi:hypothetical protein